MQWPAGLHTWETLTFPVTLNTFPSAEGLWHCETATVLPVGNWTHMMPLAFVVTWFMGLDYRVTKAIPMNIFLHEGKLSRPNRHTHQWYFFPRGIFDTDPNTNALQVKKYTRDTAGETQIEKPLQKCIKPKRQFFPRRGKPAHKNTCIFSTWGKPQNPTSQKH